jgi:hypothetical protein
MATEGVDQPFADEPLADRTVVADWMADRLDRVVAADVPQRQQLEAALRQFAALDRAVYQAIAEVPTPALDVAFRRLSRAADKSKLWLAIAAGLAVVGGPAGRRAAARGVLSIGATSAFVNLGVKSLWPRRRPDRAGAGVPDERQVKMPGSTSFPSGHSAMTCPRWRSGSTSWRRRWRTRGSTPASTIPATPSSARSSAPAPPPPSAPSWTASPVRNYECRNYGISVVPATPVP